MGGMPQVQPQPGQPVFMVPGGELVNSINELTKVVVRVETQVTGFPQQISELHAQVAQNTAAIAELKQWRSFVLGIGAVIVLLLTSGTVAALITAVAAHHGHH